MKAILLASCLVITLPQWAQAQETPPPAPTNGLPQAQKVADPKHAADIERDTNLGKKYAEEVVKEMKISDNADYIARVNRVAAELVPIAQTFQVQTLWGDKRLNPFNYEFKVVKDEDINAFSLPGGYIFVYEGLLKFVESDDELAGVMAHEIAHASQRHIATLEREQSKLQLITLPLILVGILAGQGGAGIQLGGLIGMAKGSGWSVQAEESADYAGFQYLTKTKYNPVGLLTFMERLARRHKGIESIDLGIFQTHPPSRDRAEAITKRLQEADIPIRRSLVSSTFRVEVRPSDKGAIGAWFNGKLLYTFAGDDAMQRAEGTAAKLNEFFDAVPDLFDVQVRDDVIFGMRKKLLEVEPQDAALVGATQPDLATSTAKNIRVSLYNLAYRVWDLR